MSENFGWELTVGERGAAGGRGRHRETVSQSQTPPDTDQRHPQRCTVVD